MTKPEYLTNGRGRIRCFVCVTYDAENESLDSWSVIMEYSEDEGRDVPMCYDHSHLLLADTIRQADRERSDRASQ